MDYCLLPKLALNIGTYHLNTVPFICFITPWNPGVENNWDSLIGNYTFLKMFLTFDSLYNLQSDIYFCEFLSKLK